MSNITQEQPYFMSQDTLDYPEQVEVKMDITDSLDKEKKSYAVTDIAGKGSFGVVTKTKADSGLITTAIKAIKYHNNKYWIYGLNTEINELNILTTLTHPNLVHAKSFTFSKEELKIVTPYYGYKISNLFQSPISIDTRSITYKLFHALLALHNNNYVHHDIKPDNILIAAADKNSYEPVIIDFGSSAYIGQSSYYEFASFSLFYAAPEYISTVKTDKYKYSAKGLRGEIYTVRDYTKAYDVWSMALVIHQLNGGQLLAKSTDYQDYYKARANAYQSMMYQLFDVDPDKRLTIKQALNSKYFESLTKPNIIFTIDEFGGVNVEINKIIPTLASVLKDYPVELLFLIVSLIQRVGNKYHILVVIIVAAKAIGIWKPISEWLKLGNITKDKLLQDELKLVTDLEGVTHPYTIYNEARNLEELVAGYKYLSDPFSFKQSSEYDNKTSSKMVTVGQYMKLVSNTK